MLRAAVLSIALCQFVFMPRAEAEELSLRLHWEPGQTYILEVTTDTTGKKPDGSGAAGMMHVLQTTEMKVEKKADPAETLVRARFASVRGEVTANGKTRTYDSSDSKPGQDDEDLRQVLGTAVGKSFTMVYDDRDRFLDIRDLAEMATGPGEKMGLIALAQSRDVAMLFRKSMEVGLPAVPVSPGDSWTADETMVFPQAGEVRVQMNGKLEGVEVREGRKHARVTFEGTFGNTAPRPGKPVALMEITSDSTMSGTLFFDLERRMVSLSDYKTDIKMMAPGQLLGFEQRIVSKMTRKETPAR